MTIEMSEQTDPRAQLGEYVTTALRQELSRTQGTATCLLSTLSFVGSASAAGLASTTPRTDLPTMMVLAAAMMLLGTALLLILVALRPRLPRSQEPTTGWPLVPRLSSDQYDQHAQDYSEFLRKDAVTLASITRKKFRVIRAAFDLTIAGLPLLALGLLLWL